MRMDVSVLENRVAARQQKTDANYLPVSAVEQNISWHLLCLSKAAVDVSQQVQKSESMWSRIEQKFLHFGKDDKMKNTWYFL